MVIEDAIIINIYKSCGKTQELCVPVCNILYTLRKIDGKETPIGLITLREDSNGQLQNTCSTPQT